MTASRIVVAFEQGADEPSFLHFREGEEADLEDEYRPIAEENLRPHLPSDALPAHDLLLAIEPYLEEQGTASALLGALVELGWKLHERYGAK